MSLVTQKQNTLFDYDSRGGFDSNGNIRKLYNEEALRNSIAMWLGSLTGEVVRYPAWGGFLMDMMYQPMREDDIDEYRMSIFDGFEQNFTPFSEISDLRIVPNFQERTWEVDMLIYTPTFNYELNFSASIVNLA